MSHDLDESYLPWLYAQVGSVKVKNPSRTYWTLLRQLYTKEFIWFVANDDNRAEDGKDLRYEFLADKHIEDVDPEWMQLGCSMLEMLIALSRRASMQDGHEARDWFWVFLRNLGLDACTDRSRYNQDQVDRILEDLIHRRYAPDGSGGIFPMSHHTAHDQRRVEIWYQLCEYLLQQM